VLAGPSRSQFLGIRHFIEGIISTNKLDKKRSEGDEEQSHYAAFSDLGILQPHRRWMLGRRR
jgi:hypothetical protein